MSLTTLGEKIVAFKVAQSKQEYFNQLDTFYSYCRWFEIIQALGKKKSEALSNLMSRMGYFMHVFAVCHMDDHLVDFLTRNDEDLYNEMRLFAALDPNDLEMFRTGWVRFKPVKPWPVDGDKLKRIVIPEGTVVYPSDNSAYKLKTVIPYEMVKSDGELSNPGVDVPVRTVKNEEINNLPKNQTLQLDKQIEGIAEVINPTEIRFRKYTNEDLLKVLQDTLVKDMVGVGESTSPSNIREQESETIDTEGLKPDLVRVWMERHTSLAWRYSTLGGELISGFAGLYAALRITSYIDLLTARLGVPPGLIRASFQELANLPIRVLSEPYMLLKRGLAVAKGQEPPWTYRERWENTKRYYRQINNTRSVQLRNFKAKLTSKNANVNLEEPAEESLIPDQSTRLSRNFTENSYAESLDTPPNEITVGDAIKIGAIEPDPETVDVQRNILNREFVEDIDLLPDTAVNNLASTRNLANENADSIILEDLEDGPIPTRIAVTESSEAALVNGVEESGARAVEIEGEEGLSEMSGESIAGDVAGVVLFVAIDVVVGILEGFKEKKQWEDAANAVQQHANTMAKALKKLLQQYENLVTTYQYTLVSWNDMLRDVFIDPKTNQVVKYPDLMPASEGEHDPAWYKNYVPIDTNILKSAAFKKLLTEDGLPKVIKDSTDPNLFVSELGKDDNKLPTPAWSITDSRITWEELNKIATDKSYSPIHVNQFKQSTSMQSNPLNVYDKWSIRFTSNLELILSFRSNFIRFVINQQVHAGDDWSMKVNDFASKMEKQIELIAQLSKVWDKYDEYKKYNMPVPDDSWKNGITEQKLQYYTYIYNYLSDKQHGKGLEMAQVTQIPTKDTTLDLKNKLEQHIRIWVEDKASRDQQDEYVKELKSIAPKFGVYSDLLLATQIKVGDP